MPATTRPISIAVLAAIAVLGVLWAMFGGTATVAGAATADPDAPPVLSALELASAECLTGAIAVEADNITLVLDMAVTLYDGSLNYDTGDVTFEEITCVLGELNAPTSVTARMDSTRALDGMQDAEWGKFAASWTYHPDAGLDVIITQS